MMGRLAAILTRCAAHKLLGMLLTALLIAMSWFTGCAAVGSDAGGAAVCPLAVAYSLAEQAQPELLARNAAVVGVMDDYTVMREQARQCAGTALR